MPRPHKVVTDKYWVRGGAPRRPQVPVQLEGKPVTRALGQAAARSSWSGRGPGRPRAIVEPYWVQ